MIGTDVSQGVEVSETPSSSEAMQSVTARHDVRAKESMRSSHVTGPPCLSSNGKAAAFVSTCQSNAKGSEVICASACLHVPVALVAISWSCSIRVWSTCRVSLYSMNSETRAHLYIWKVCRVGIGLTWVIRSADALCTAGSICPSACTSLRT